jgi:hypothetical protein
MRILVGTFAALGLFLALPALADDVAPPDQGDVAFDAQFVCPDAIADRDARIDEFQRYMDWTRDHHPDWDLRKRLDVRYGLLRRHACAVTLAHLAASQRPAFGP